MKTTKKPVCHSTHAIVPEAKPNPHYRNWYVGWKPFHQTNIPGYGKVKLEGLKKNLDYFKKRTAESRGRIEYAQKHLNEIYKHTGTWMIKLGIQGLQHKKALDLNPYLDISEIEKLSNELEPFYAFSLNNMRFNQLIPKGISSVFTGIKNLTEKDNQGKEFQVNYNVFIVNLVFSPQLFSDVYPQNIYPDQLSIARMLHTLKLETFSKDDEDKTLSKVFQEITRKEREISRQEKSIETNRTVPIQEITEIVIDIPPIFEELIVNISIEGTICDIFNEIARLFDLVWDWSPTEKLHFYFLGKENINLSICCCDDLN